MSDWTKEDYKNVRKDLKKSGYFLPVSNGKFEALGWIADIPLGYDLLQATRKNPLFEKWECKHTHELKQHIEENADLLKEIREKQQLRIFENLNKCDTQQEKRTLLNHFLDVIDTQPLSDWLDDLRSKLRGKREELDKQSMPNSNKNPFQSSKPHKDEVYKRYSNLRNNHKYKAVEPSFYKLKEELETADWNPKEFGIRDEPYHFNRAWNDWKKKQHEKSASQN